MLLAQNTSNKPITISEVAKELNISTRTVLRDMTKIESWLDENDFKFIKKPGVGIYLDETLDSKQFIIELLQEEKIEKSYSIPIVNKRISVTPIALVGGSACKTPEDFATIAATMDRAAKTVGVNLIGGYSALVSKGMTKADELLIRSIPQALHSTERVCSSVNLASTKTGINMDAVRLMGEIVKKTAEATKENDSLGCAKLVVFCNAPDDNPFMAGAFHGVTEAEAIINVGVSGPGVVKTALEKVRRENFEVLCETIKKTAFKITRVGQLVAQGTLHKRSTPHGSLFDITVAMRAYCSMLEARAGPAKTEEEIKQEIKQEKAKAAADVTMKIAKANIAKAEADELQGKMHRSEDVAAMTTDLIYAIRGAMMALPGRLAVDVASANSPAEAAEIIRREVNKAMRELSNYRYDPKKYEERVRERRAWEADSGRDADDG